MNQAPEVADLSEARRRAEAASTDTVQLATVRLFSSPRKGVQAQFGFAPGVDPMQVLIAIVEAAVTQMNAIHTANRAAAAQAERRIVVPQLQLPKHP